MAKGTQTRKPATVKIWFKHNAPRNWTRQVILRTAHNEAKFKPGQNVTALANLYHDETKSTQIDPSNFFARLSHVVGASEGEETKYILIKLSGGDIHARPITLQELRNNFGADI